MRFLWLPLLALFAWPAYAAPVEISNLPAGSALVGGETAPFVQSGATVKITGTQIKTFVLGTDAVTTTAIADGTVAEVDINAIDSPSDEECLTYEGGNFEWQACGAGSQTPWASNIDADTFDLLDVGDIVVGSGTKLATFSGPTTPSLQVAGTTADTAAIGIARFANSVGEASLQLAKSRGVTVGSYTIAADGDTLGTIMFEGSDGTDFASSAGIEVLLNGTPGNNDMPGLMVFRTSPDNSADPDNQLWIDQNGVVYIANNNGSVLDPISAFTGSASTPTFQIAGITANRSALGIARFSNANAHPTIRLAKSRGTTHASYTISQTGDGIGEIIFEASDGTDFGRAAAISSYLNGTPASAGDTSDTPGMLVFATSADGTDSPTDRWAIDSAGRLTGPLASTAVTVMAGQSPAIQILGLTHDDSSIGMARFSANSFAPVIHIGKSRGATVGSYTIVQDGDQLGNVSAMASDGVDFFISSEVNFLVDDGSPASNDVGGMIKFSTAPGGGGGASTPRWRIGADGVLSGPTANASVALFSGATQRPGFQILGTDTNTSAIAQTRYSANSSAPVYYFGKSRGASIGTNTIVAASDSLGFITFAGADDTNYDIAAQIGAIVDGTPAAGADMPGRLELSTSPDNSATPASRVTIKNDGGVLIGPNDSGHTGQALDIDNGILARFFELEANGDNYLGFEAPDTVTTSQTCTFENDGAAFVPDSCVGDGSDASDVRLKKDFKVAGDVGPLLDRVRMYNFTWKTDAPKAAEMVRAGKSGFGPKAQELYNVMPDLVKKGGNDPLTDPWTWKPEKLVPYLLVEIQQLRKRVAELERH